MTAKRHIRINRRRRRGSVAPLGIANVISRPVCRPMAHATEPAPIWMAALLATRCHAAVNGSGRAIRWECVAGRALYTNRSKETEWIQPLGVRLQDGETLAVSWLPGETSYTLEVENRETQCLVA